MRVAIHQPVFFPWLGWVDKAARVDLLVIADHVRPDLASPHTRAAYPLCGEKKLMVLSLQKAQDRSATFRTIQLAGGRPPANAFAKMYAAYRKAPYWPSLADRLKTVLEAEYSSLFEANLASMRMTLEIFRVDTKIVLGSSLTTPFVEDSKAGRTVSICKAVGATSYLSGNGAKVYMRDELFASHGIDVQYQNFHHPQYAQGEQAFVDAAMALDWYMWSGSIAVEKFHAGI